MRSERWCTNQIELEIAPDLIFCCQYMLGKLTLSIYRQLNTDRHIIHGNLLISIAISQTVFLVGIEQTHNKVCKQQ